MPVNKNALFRYRVLDKLFRHRRGYTMDELVELVSEHLAEEFGIASVSRRTLYYDINVMKSLPPRGFNAPVINRNGRYKYADPEFTIFPVYLTREDVESLMMLYNALKNRKVIKLQSYDRERVQWSLEKIFRLHYDLMPDGESRPGSIVEKAKSHFPFSPFTAFLHNPLRFGVPDDFPASHVK